MGCATLMVDFRKGKSMGGKEAIPDERSVLSTLSSAVTNRPPEYVRQQTLQAVGLVKVSPLLCAGDVL